MVLDDKALILLGDRQNLPKECFCQICDKLLCKPIRTARGRHACLKCYEKALSFNNTQCPIDKQPITDEEIFIDEEKEQLILYLPCCCVNEIIGCEWKGNFKELEEHKEHCMTTENPSNSMTAIAHIDLSQALHSTIPRFNLCHEGVFVWRIDNYTKRMNESKSGSTTALHSAPCLTNPYGYKFCARLYMNGDGMGRGTRLSLFIVLMQFDYDSILNWPFDMGVHMSILNQHGRKNIGGWVETSAGINSPSRQRPKSYMNEDQLGIESLIRCNLLQEGFLVNDTIFIKIQLR